MKKFILILIVLNFTIAAKGQNSIKMYYNNEEIVKIIDDYSKATGQKFILDPAVRGKISILIPGAVTYEEAFNHLSSSLAINGFAISKQGDTMVIKSARNIQRDLIEVGTQVPSLKPERMFTWVYTFKNIKADEVNKEIRILPSKDGEMNVFIKNNQIIFTDWSSNLNRISLILKEIDVKTSSSVLKK